MPAPLNDNWASAEVISGASGSVVGTLVSATRETGEPDILGAAEPTVWYAWTAPADGPLYFEVVQDNGGVTWDSMIGVFTGASLLALTCVAFMDDRLADYGTHVAFDAAAGTTYYVQVSAWDPPIAFTMTWGAATPPANARFADAAVLVPAPPGTTFGTASNVDAIGDHIWASHISHHSWPPPTLWWTFHNTYTRSYSLAFQTNTNTVLAATGDSAADILSVSSGTVTATANPGDQFWFALADTYYPEENDSLAWFFNATPSPPANDNWANAIALTGSSGSTTGDNVAATYESPDEDATYGTSNTKSVWWKWTAPANGTFTVDDTGTVYSGASTGNVLEVWSGDSLDTLNFEASTFAGSLHTATATVTAGTHYYVRLFQSAGHTGTIALAWSFTPTTPRWPHLSSYTPSTVVVGARIHLTGTDLDSTTAVTIGGVPASFYAVSSTLLIARVPALTYTGSTTVSVVASNGSGSTTLTGLVVTDPAGTFRFIGQQHTVASGGGTRVPLPPGAADGDLLLLIAAAPSLTGMTVTTSGWTQGLYSTSHPQRTLQGQKIVDSSDFVADVYVSSVTDTVNYVVVAYRGFADVEVGSVFEAGSATVEGSVAVTDAAAEIVWIPTTINLSGTPSDPAGTTNRYNDPHAGSATVPGIGVWDEPVTGAEFHSIRWTGFTADSMIVFGIPLGVRVVTFALTVGAIQLWAPAAAPTRVTNVAAGSGQYFTSSTGGLSWDVWFTVTDPYPTNAQGFVFAQNKWVSFGNGTEVMIQTDPKKPGVIHTAPMRISSLLWDGTQWVAAGGTAFSDTWPFGKAATSPDAVTWTMRTSPFDGGTYDDAVVSSPGVVAYWALNETVDADTTAYDSTPGALSGTYNGTAGVDYIKNQGRLTDNVGSAVAFDGGWISIPTDVVTGGHTLQDWFTSGPGWSIELWASWAAGAISDEQYLFGWDGALWIVRDGSRGGDFLSVGYYDALGNPHELLGSVPGTGPYAIALSWNTATSTLDLWLNGVRYASATDAVNVPNFPVGSASIGRNGSTAGGCFHGTIDNVALYNTPYDSLAAHQSLDTYPRTNKAGPVVHGDRYVLLGTTDTYFGGGPERVATSPDAVTWTARSSPIDVGVGNAIAWDGTRYLVAGQDDLGDGLVMTSVDGASWTAHPTPVFRNLIWNGTIYLASVASASPAIYTSTDAITWTGHASLFDGKSGLAVCWDPNELRWVASWTDFNDFATSTDGITWTRTDVFHYGATGESSGFGRFFGASTIAAYPPRPPLGG